MGFENGKTVEVTLKAILGSDSQVNTFVYDLDDNNDVQPNDPQSLADTFRDDVIPLWKTLYNAAWTVEPVEVTQVKDPQNPLAPRQSWTSGTAIPGTNPGTGDSLPPNCSVLVHLGTDHIGRRFNGRLWLGGTTYESQQAGGVWAASYLTAIASITDAIPRQPDIAGPGSSATAKWSVYSRTQRAANLDPYLSAITSVVSRSQVHMLRSRALYA